jgi:hypothetical protein
MARPGGRAASVRRSRAGVARARARARAKASMMRGARRGALWRMGCSRTAPTARSRGRDGGRSAQREMAAKRAVARWRAARAHAAAHHTERAAAEAAAAAAADRAAAAAAAGGAGVRMAAAHSDVQKRTAVGRAATEESERARRQQTRRAAGHARRATRRRRAPHAAAATAALSFDGSTHEGRVRSTVDSSHGGGQRARAIAAPQAVAAAQVAREPVAVAAAATAAVEVAAAAVQTARGNERQRRIARQAHTQAAQGHAKERLGAAGRSEVGDMGSAAPTAAIASSARGARGRVKVRRPEDGAAAKKAALAWRERPHGRLRRSRGSGRRAANQRREMWVDHVLTWPCCARKRTNLSRERAEFAGETRRQHKKLGVIPGSCPHQNQGSCTKQLGWLGWQLVCAVVGHITSATCKIADHGTVHSQSTGKSLSLSL